MAQSSRETIICAGRESFKEAVKEFWEYRELLYMLAWRQVSLRYKQTALGIGWVILQPLTAVVIFSVIFGRFAQLPSDGIPYPIFTYSALIIWTLFSQGIDRSGSSLIAESRLITKVYFPRLIIPLAAVGSALVDFGVSLLVLLPMSYVYGVRLSWSLLLLPVAVGMTVVLATGVGMLMAALNVRYRDFQYALPFLVQVWLYASPVVYSVKMVPVSARGFYYLNPMAGVIELSRFAVTGVGNFSWVGLGLSGVIALGFFVLGYAVFSWVEGSFAKCRIYNYIMIEKNYLKVVGNID